MDKQHDSPSGGQPLDEHKAQGEEKIISALIKAGPLRKMRSRPPRGKPRRTPSTPA